MDIKRMIKTAEPIALLNEITTERWHELRKTGVGGSEAGAILGLSKYQSPLSLWILKTGRTEPDEGNENTEYGNILENPIRHEVFPKYFEKETGTRPIVLKPKYMWRSTEHQHMLANIDGFVHYNGKLYGLEIKTGSSYMLKDWGGRNGEEVPDTYYAQVQHYMAVLGLDEFILFGAIGNTAVIRWVPRNDDFIGGDFGLINSERLFFDRVKSGKPEGAPMPIGTDADMDALMNLSDPQSDDVTEIDSTLPELYAEYRDREKEWEDKKEEVKQQIIKELGQAKYGIADGYKVTFNKVLSKRIDTKSLKASEPEIARKYTKQTESGRLTVKEVDIE